MSTLLIILQTAKALAVALSIQWTDVPVLACPSWYDGGVIISVCLSDDQKRADVYLSYGQE